MRIEPGPPMEATVWTAVTPSMEPRVSWSSPDGASFRSTWAGRKRRGRECGETGDIGDTPTPVELSGLCSDTKTAERAGTASPQHLCPGPPGRGGLPSGRGAGIRSRERDHHQLFRCQPVPDQGIPGTLVVVKASIGQIETDIRPIPHPTFEFKLA